MREEKNPKPYGYRDVTLCSVKDVQRKEKNKI